MIVPPLGPAPGGGPGPVRPGRAVGRASEVAPVGRVGRQGTPPDSSSDRALLVDVVREALTMGQPAQALELLDGVWGKVTSREDAWFLRGQALYELQRFTEAGQVTQQGLSRHPQSAALLYLLCNCEFQLNHFEAAERAIQQAMTLLPEHPLIRARYAHLLARMGRMAEAAEQLTLAEALAPGHLIVAQERRFLAAVTSGPFGTEHKVGALLHETADPYARAALGMSLLPKDPRLLAAEAAAAAEARRLQAVAVPGPPDGGLAVVLRLWWVAAIGAAGLSALAGQPLVALACAGAAAVGAALGLRRGPARP